VLHLYVLFGGVFGHSPLTPWHARLDMPGAFGVLVLMLPVLLAAAWLWRAAKQRAPHEARLALVLLTVTFLYEFAVRPW
jgi:hypothetical protein